MSELDNLMPRIVVDKNAKQDVISNFKVTCREVFIIDGEFDYDELIKDGHQLLFT